MARISFCASLMAAAVTTAALTGLPEPPLPLDVFPPEPELGIAPPSSMIALGLTPDNFESHK